MSCRKQCWKKKGAKKGYIKAGLYNLYKIFIKTFLPVKKAFAFAFYSNSRKRCCIFFALQHVCSNRYHCGNCCGMGPLHMQALKAASQQTEAFVTPTKPPSLDPVPPQGIPGQSPSHPQDVAPAKHTPSAEQVAILALTSNSKATAREATVALKLGQQLQQQLQEQLPQQQPLSVSSGKDSANSSAAETGQHHAQSQYDSLSVVHRQLSEEFKREESVAESVSEEAQSELGSIEVCTGLYF